MESRKQIVCTEEELLALNKNLLLDFCRQHKLPVYGSKQILASRIIMYQVEQTKSKSSIRGSTEVDVPNRKRPREFPSPPPPSSRPKTPINPPPPIARPSASDEYPVDFPEIPPIFSKVLDKLSPIDKVMSKILPATSITGLITPVKFNVPNALMEKIHAQRGKYQIQLRCIQLTQNVMSWPPDCKVVLNNSIVFNKAWHGGEDYPLNITKLLSSNTNYLQIISTSEDYVFGVYFIRRRNTSSLVNKAIQKNCPSLLASKLRICARITLDIRCPLLKSKMIWPGRGKKCSHVECFDIKAFYERVRNFPEFGNKCPICQEPLQELWLDTALIKLLKGFPEESRKVTIEAKMLLDHKSA